MKKDEIELAMAENTIELADQCIEELQNHFRGTPVTRQSIIRDYIIPWAKEAEWEWQSLCRAGSDEMYQYYDFIDKFARRKLEELDIRERSHERYWGIAIEALVKIAHYDDDDANMYDPSCQDGHICADIAREALGKIRRKGNESQEDR